MDGTGRYPLLDGILAPADLRKLPAGKLQALAAELRAFLIETVATGGDDYEILCAVSPDRLDLFREQARAAAILISDIGEIVAGDGPPQVFGADGKAISFERGSFSHF